MTLPPAVHDEIRSARPASRIVRRPTAWAAACATVATLLGCASGGQPVPLTPGLDGPRHATMEVRNDHNHPVFVSVMRSDGGTLMRMGDVDPNSDDAFRLPLPLNGEPVRIVVQCRVTRETYETHEVVWEPTQHVELAVGSFLPLTKLALR